MSELTEAEFEEGIKRAWSDWPAEFSRKVIALARKGLEAEKYDNAMQRQNDLAEMLDYPFPTPPAEQQQGNDGTWERCPTCMQQHFVLSDGAAVKRGFVDPATVPSPPTEAAPMGDLNDANVGSNTEGA